MKILKFILFWFFSLNFYAFDLVEADNNMDKAVCNSTEMDSRSCFYKKDRIKGMKRICTYDCLSGYKDIEMSSIKLCPLKIDDT